VDIKCLTILFFFLSASVYAQQGRMVQSVNSNWSFHKGEIHDSSSWQKVNLPHTFNVSDPFDEEKGYYRGVSWYKHKFLESRENQSQFLYFEAVNQIAEVYINGEFVKRHKGGYTAFSVPLSDYVKNGVNEIKVKVDNNHNKAIVPLKGDFNFYGGIYRDVWLISTSTTHFGFSEFGDLGIFISTPKVSEEVAQLHVKSHITSLNAMKISVDYQLFDPEGKEVLTTSKGANISKGNTTIEHDLPMFERPKLWHPDHPYLYRLHVSLRDEKANLLDDQTIPIGVRWFRFDADNGFFLNNKPLKLIGTNRHQDFDGLGNALSDDRHLKDVKLIKAMGSNFFRTAHYPQDPTVLQASDQLGLLVSMEIPLDHDITDSKEFYDNTKHMMKEMIRQYYNHPSIIIWAYMNEMLLGRRYERDEEIISKITAFAQKLEDLTRSEDNTRYTMIPNHGQLGLYHKAGLTQIPMIVGCNLYFGWYAEQLGGGSFLDEVHDLIPDKPILVTEYGAGADPRIRSLEPVRFDFSIEWQTKFHQYNLSDFMERPFVAGAAIWNLADFGSENRNDAVPKINSKGVISFDRKPKDSYHLYQAWLKERPFLKIGGMDWQQRVDYKNSQSIQVFSNSDSVSLSVNGSKAELETSEHNVTAWHVQWRNGINHLEAKAYYTDTTLVNTAKVDFNKVDKEYLESSTIHINCGAPFFFNDPTNHVSWLPDREYDQNLSGYTRGKVYKQRNRGVGTDAQIYLTDNEPVYQTMLINPEYYFDVVEGHYQITFHWAELERKYNGESKRIFDVLINGSTILSDIEPVAAGFRTAQSIKVKVETNKPGLKISFRTKSGEAIINAIEIRKL